MNEKTNRRLFGLLLIQMLLVAALFWPRTSKTSVENGLFTGVDWAKINDVTIQEAGKALELRREGGTWVIPAQASFPADEKRITDLFDKLKNLKTGLVVSKTAPSFERLQVSDEKFQRKLSLKFDGDKTDGLYLGSAPQYRRAHLRRLGQNEVFTTDKLSAFDLSTKSEDWLKRDLVKTDSKDIVGIELKRRGETLTFRRIETKAEEKDVNGVVIKPGETAWMLNGKPVNTAKFEAILRNLSSLSLSAVLGTENKTDYGVTPASPTIKLTLKQGDKTVDKIFTIGAKKDADYVVHAGDSPFYVKVSAYLLAPVMDAKRAEFVATK